MLHHFVVPGGHGGGNLEPFAGGNLRQFFVCFRMIIHQALAEVFQLFALAVFLRQLAHSDLSQPCLARFLYERGITAGEA